LVISSTFLVVVVAWAILLSLPRTVIGYFRGRKEETYAWDDPDKWHHEQPTTDPRYYAQQVGLDIVESTIQTEDGFLIRYVGKTLKSRDNLTSSSMQEVVGPEDPSFKKGVSSTQKCRLLAQTFGPQEINGFLSSCCTAYSSPRAHS
jgi:hypothetical protein